VDFVKFGLAIAAGYIGASILFKTFHAFQAVATPTVTSTTSTPVTGGISPYNLVTGQPLPTGPSYDQSKVIPCLTGDC